LQSILIYKAKKNKVKPRTKIKKQKAVVSKKIQLTPRGQLHKENHLWKTNNTLLKRKKVENFTADRINNVAQKRYREALKTIRRKYGDPESIYW
jgi:CRISPR-associated endonuclease Csn1